MVVVRFKGVSDRSAAEALTGTELFVDRSALPDDGDEDEFYHADLVGLEVRDGTGAVLGRVVAVHDFGGGDILDVTLGHTKGVLIPFSKAAVPEVSVAGGFVRIDPVAAGLVADEDGGPDVEPAPGSMLTRPPPRSTACRNASAASSPSARRCWPASATTCARR